MRNPLFSPLRRAFSEDRTVIYEDLFKDASVSTLSDTHLSGEPGDIGKDLSTRSSRGLSGSSPDEIPSPHDSQKTFKAAPLGLFSPRLRKPGRAREDYSAPLEVLASPTPSFVSASGISRRTSEAETPHLPGPLAADLATPPVTTHAASEEPGLTTREEAPAPGLIDRSFKEAELTAHLTAIFAHRGKSADEIRSLGRDICLFLNSKLGEIDALRENSIRFSKNTPINVGGSQSVTLPFSGWIKINADGTGMRLQIIPPETAIGAGTFKKVKKSFAFHLPISRSPDGSRDIRMSQAVLQRIKDQAGSEMSAVRSGLDRQKEVLALAGEGTRFVPAVDMYTECLGKNGNLKLETYQEWFNGDLLQAINTECVPLDVDCKQTKAVSFKDRMVFLMDIASSLKVMHDAGLVHRDIKPANILLKEEGSKIHAYLSDFDLTTKPGMTNVVSAYHYWDCSGKLGYADYSADIVGFAMTAGEALLPGFYPYFRDNPSKILVNPTQHFQKLGSDFIFQTLFNAGFDFSKADNLRIAFERLGGDPSRFQDFLTAYIAAPASGISPEESANLRKVSIDLTQCHRVFQMIHDITACNLTLRHSIAGIPHSIFNTLMADPSLMEARLRELVVDAGFPKMEQILERLASFQTSLAAEYIAVGIA